MDNITLQIKRIADVPLPCYATDGSAGLDLTASLGSPLTLAPLGRAIVPTGIAVALPSAAFVGLIFARSGLAVKYGVTASNGVGVIDSDYRGEIKVGLCNLSDSPYTISPGDRIAQLVVMPVAQCTVVPVEELGETQRGDGGFGSTGR